MYKLPDLHYHSITAHAPCVTVPLTAVFYALFLYTGDVFYNIAHISLIIMSFLSIFVVFITGYLEREKKYTNWTNLFKAKMFLTIVHFIALWYQIITIIVSAQIQRPYGTLYAAITIVIQLLSILMLTYLGLITAQGRVGGKLSYKDDPENKLSYDIVKVVKKTQPDPLKEVPYDRL